MNKVMRTIALVGAFGVSTAAFGNGLAEDRPWQFEDENAKYYKLQTERERMFLDAGGWTNHYNTYVSGDQYNSACGFNSINCAVTTITNSDNVDVTNTLKAKENKQTNADIEVGQPLVIILADGWTLTDLEEFADDLD